MSRIPIASAVEELPYTKTDIEETVRDYDLAIDRDSDDAIATIDKKALERVLEARNIRKTQPHLKMLIEALPDAVKEKVNDHVSKVLTAITAGAAAIAAIVALLQMHEAKKALYAQNLYQAMSNVADAMERALTADNATGPTQLEGFFHNLDARIEIIYDLRQSGGILEADWKNFLGRYCVTLHQNDYFAREDLFSSAKAMCDTEKEKGKWKPSVPPENQSDKQGDAG